MGKIPSRGSDQFVLRFPSGMRDLIREVAEKNGRSMNAEIIARLTESFDTDQIQNDPKAAAEALLPFTTEIYEEVAKRYDNRFLKMEAVLTDFSRLIREGKVDSSNSNEIADVIDAGLGRRKEKREAKTSSTGGDDE